MNRIKNKRKTLECPPFASSFHVFRVFCGFHISVKPPCLRVSSAAGGKKCGLCGGVALHNRAIQGIIKKLVSRKEFRQEVQDE